MEVVNASDQMIESNRSFPFKLGRLLRVEDVEDCEDDGSSVSGGVVIA